MTPGIELSPAAMRTISTAIWAARTDGFETGGALFGSPSEISRAAGPGLMDKRGPDWIVFDSFAGEDLCGTWHTHPDGAPAQPSREDLESWARIRDRLHRRHVAGLIVTVGRDRSWHSSKLHGFHIGRLASGEPTCEPATVNEKGSQPMPITLTTPDGRRLPLEEELAHRRAMIDGTDYVVVRRRGSVEERHYPEGGPIVTRAYTGRDRHTLIR